MFQKDELQCSIPILKLRVKLKLNSNFDISFTHKRYKNNKSQRGKRKITFFFFSLTFFERSTKEKAKTRQED